MKITALTVNMLFTDKTTCKRFKENSSGNIGRAAVWRIMKLVPNISRFYIDDGSPYFKLSVMGLWNNKFITEKIAVLFKPTKDFKSSDFLLLSSDEQVSNVSVAITFNGG